MDYGEFVWGFGGYFDGWIGGIGMVFWRVIGEDGSGLWEGGEGVGWEGVGGRGLGVEIDLWSWLGLGGGVG
jgi:hypothetical protein